MAKNDSGGDGPAREYDHWQVYFGGPAAGYTSAASASHYRYCGPRLPSVASGCLPAPVTTGAAFASSQFAGAWSGSNSQTQTDHEPEPDVHVRRLCVVSSNYRPTPPTHTLV